MCLTPIFHVHCHLKLPLPVKLILTRTRAAWVVILFLLYFTDEVVDVIPLTNRYTALCDVPVAGSATHIQLGDGSEYTLVVN